MSAEFTMSQLLAQSITSNKKQHNKTGAVNAGASVTIKKARKPETIQLKLKHVMQPAKKLKKLTVLDKMSSKMDGAKFRMLNQDFYTQKSSAAFDRFQRDPQLFDLYHAGFRQQVSQWPVNPLDIIQQQLSQQIKIMGKKSQLNIADMGCGEAVLARDLTSRFPNRVTVHSFDLVAANDRITACNIAHTPLQNASVDFVVFCLSLMGNDHTQFLREAHRIMKTGGTLKIAEVESRFVSVDAFIEWMESTGYKLRTKYQIKMFVQFDFVKSGEWRHRDKDEQLFKPCIYKRR